MKHKRSHAGFHHIGLLLLAVVLVTAVFVGLRVRKHTNQQTGSPSNIINSDESAASKAIKAGQLISYGKCEGTDKLTFTHLPMREQDFSILIPYGLMVDDHVTPIDHQYFSPADYNSARDAYPVYAMADATITDVQPRTTDRGTEYRLVFTHSCTSLYYYDLVTSLSGKVKEAYEKNSRDFNLKVKAGEQIGAIGGQTLDFAYWDTDKPLAGFANPASYDAEPWKIYTTDPYPMYTPELRELLVARNPRTTAPIAGKIDYDQPGKLIGNWFVEGTKGYGGVSGESDHRYAKTHLSISPEHFDPSYFVISMGDYRGEAEQFLTKSNSPSPADVSEAAGLIKYELVEINYRKSDDSFWDRKSLSKSIKADNSGQVVGTILAQLADGGAKLKFEAFPGKSGGQVSGFTSAVKTYTR